MNRGLDKFVAGLQVTRLAMVFTAIADIWVIALLSLAHRETWRVTPTLETIHPGVLLAATAAVAGGLYVFGMTLNDVMDARRDRLFAPTRPIPSRRISLAAATTIAVGALLVAIAASIPLGAMSTMLCLITAGLILFYNGLGKHLGAIGIVTLGLIRSVNMLIANPSLGYMWPVWLTMTHVTGLSAAGHRLEGKRPQLRGAQIWITAIGWAFVTVVMMLWMHRHNTSPPDRPWMWVGPVVAMLVFTVIGIITQRSAPTEPAAGALLIKRGLLWLIIYDAAWLASDGLWWQTAAVGALLPAAWAMMHLTRHLKAMTTPTEFRR
ncbi:hypothetical protein HED60_03575 [Planctomycetales bacterium ZRK34]|nr:hypothetical protein HED60_03575 [Planctomycetales bacterium ZRK34]